MTFIISCAALGFFCSPGTSIATSSVLLGLVLLGRAAFVFPLSYLSNLTKKSQYQKISFRQQVWPNFYRVHFSVFLALQYQVIMMTCFFPLILGDHLVGWSNERCCFNGTRVQSGTSNTSVAAAVVVFIVTKDGN